MSYSWVRDISVRKRHYGLVCLLHARTFLPSRVTGPIQNFLKHNDHLHSIAHSGQAIKMATESLCSGAVINDNQSTSSVSDFSRLILSMRPPSVVQSKAGLCMLAENERLDPDSCNNASGLSEESCVDFRSDDEDGVTGNEVKGMFKKPVDFTKIDINLLPTVIIVGRPNVGKSALFNRLIRRREALVYNTPDDHVTRDIREGVAKLGDLRFRVLDSAGLETSSSLGSILDRTSRMTANVLARSQFAVFLIDMRAGLHPLDVEVGKWLRRHASGIKLIVAMNKCESVFDGSSSLKAAADEAYRLGFGDPIAISAETGLGMTELYEVLKPMLEDYMLPVLNDGANQGNGEDNESSEVEESKLPLQLAIVGRPNVGKSTLLNTLLQEDRVLVGPEAGLTRDSIREHFEFQGRTIYLVDTAGWLQRTKQEKGPSSLSIVQSRKSLMRAHVVALVLDADEIAKARRSMKHDEVVIARRAVEEGRGLVVIVNKMDLLSGKQNKNLYAKVMEAVPLEIQTNIPQVTGIPVVFISALEGRGRIAVIRQVIDTYEKWCLRLSTARLNRWLRKVMSRHSWKDQAAQPKIKYFTQVKARPPTFVAFVSGKKQLLDTDLRFLTKSLKEDFDLGGIPIRIMQRSVSRKDTGSASKSGQSSGRSS
ncbi:hypothetical protein F2P56_028644 [Juglans regia]|uniref:GTPase Der n=2 Tax=Juglans regia TaxID=51240 RepID=A0A2I4FUX0_JUGRE|nr:GTPase Der isoform X1 [Juglans regia]XP_035540533.1 GTPase Der isoform X1 [Juglans regia]XP_035540534.1 GTPase Der isoform X1 [Juglans regia]KAF5448078.1 hypothetical protein F2P56_028644 [Juglans regia]